MLMSPETAAELAALRGEMSAAVAWIDENTPQPPLSPGAVVRVMGDLLRDGRAIRAERDRLRDRVAELELERHSTNEALSKAAETLRAQVVRIAELEQQLANAKAERADRHDDLAGALGYANEDWADLISIAAANTATVSGRDARPAPYRSSPLPPRDAICAGDNCGHSGAEHHHGDTRCWAHLPRLREADGTWSAVRLCTCKAFVAGGVL